MDPYTIIIAAISLIQPPIIEIIKYYWTSKLTSEQVQKSINTLSAMILGIGISALVNWLGGFNLGKFNIFLYGTGLYAIGQLAHRGINASSFLKKNLTVKGKNGDSNPN